MRAYISSDNVSSVHCTLSHFLCPLSSISSHLSLFLTISLSFPLPLTYLVSIYLSVASSPIIFLVFPPPFLSSQPLCPLYPLLCLVYCVYLLHFSPPISYVFFSFYFLLIPCFLSSSPVSNIPSLSFILSLTLSLSFFYLPTYRSFFPQSASLSVGAY